MTKEKNKGELLFSVTKKDFEIQTFRGSGNGGQNRNKVESCVRIIHTASGARAEDCQTRDQWKNKQAAFMKLVESYKFKVWHRIETAKHQGMPSIEQILDEMMKESNLKIEVRDESGKWVEVD